MDYKEFLENKKHRAKETGFTPAMLPDFLFPFQKYCVNMALKAGRYALFEDCGLGKTVQQLVWADCVSAHTNKPVLILCPLAVAGQTVAEGERFGISVSRTFSGNIHIANYEQIDNINPDIYAGIVLDESSIIKNFEGAIRNKIISGFKDTPYKLACTATPSPNDPMELGNHSEFLNVMSRSEMLAMYFTHDGGETSKWRLKGHSRKAFWRFVSSWAVMLSKPSDIGFEDNGYDLPPLNLVERKIITPSRDNGQLFNDVAISATNFNAELRITKISRLSEVADLVSGADNFIVWIKQNEEGDYLRSKIDCVEVKGSDTPEYKESKLLGFAKNEFRILLTKTKIAQFGLNYQNCHNQVFASLDFSFEGLYQAIRRSYRFGQEHPVNIFLITTDTMSNVIQSIMNKKAQFEEMQKEMTSAMNVAHGNVEKKINSLQKMVLPKFIKTWKSKTSQSRKTTESI